MDLLIDPMRPAWHAGALCALPGNDPAWWYPEQGTPGLVSMARALEVCALCPVRARCLQDATDRGERYGIHGGKNFSDSAAVAAKRRAA